MAKVAVTRVFRENLAADEQVVINRGGARSSKSHSLAQLFIYKMTNQSNKVFGICRKTMPSLKMTAYKLFIQLLKEYGRYNRKNHNKTENFYDYGSNRTYFFSVDDPEKMKSTEFNDIWMEEATEFNYDDFMTLKMRLSGKVSSGERNHLYLAFNPVDEFNWIPAKVVGRPDTIEIISTYKDNPTLSPDYVKLLEGLQKEDQNYWRIYGLGEWGQLEHLIYKKWDKVTSIPEDGEVIHGLDFGFNHPNALIEITQKDDEFWLRQRIYETGMTNADLMDEMDDKEINTSSEIYADSAEPDRIEEISRRGYNIFSANKSVKDGLDFCKRVRLHIHEDSVDVLKEVQGYKYKVDKKGNVLDEPVKFNDHAMDGFRYAIFTHYKDRNATQPWSMAVS